VGVLSERDLLRFRVNGRVASQEPVSAIMSAPPVVVLPEATFERAVELMLEKRIGCLPVVSGTKLIGIGTRSDLLRRWVQPESMRPEENQPVSALMKRAPVTATADEDVLVALARMESAGARHLPVVDREGRLVGILSDRDLRGVVGHAFRASSEKDVAVRLPPTSVGDAMTRHPVTVPESATVAQAASSMVVHRIGALPVTDSSGRPIGVVSYVDVIRRSTPAT